MSGGYALLSEIWTDDKRPKRAPVAQCKKTGELDNIMDAYLHEQPVCIQETPTVPLAKNAYDSDKLLGYDDSSLLKNAYVLDGYFKEDTEVVQETTRHEVESQKVSRNVLCEDTSVPAASMSRDEIYRDIIERYANAQAQAATSGAISTASYIELAIYIFSGIILIFMMEQILQLGRNLKMK